MKSLVTMLLIFATFADAKVVEKILAIVNDQIVTQTDVDQFKKKIETGGLVDDALLRLVDSSTLLKDRKALIQHLIDEKVLDSEVKRKNMAVTIERVEQEIRNITGKNNITRAQLKQALAEKGVALADYQDFIKTSLERQGLIEKEVTSKIKISDEDIAAAYMSKKGNAANQVFEYTLGRILFLNSRAGEAAAKRKAELVKAKLKQPDASFDKLSSQYSDDPDFSQGGEFGTFKAGEMQKDIEGAIKGLAVGETSEIVKAKNGYQIFKVLRKKLVPDPAFEKEKEKIANSLYAETFKKQFRSWLDQRRKEAFIRVN